MFIVQNRFFFFLLTGGLTLAAIAALVFWTPKLSIDFTGGSLMEVTYMDGRPALAVIQSDIAPLSLGEISIRESGDTGVVLRTHTLTPEEHDVLLAALSENGKLQVTETRFTSIGPSLGSELATSVPAGL